ncbi:conserved protein of unknown function [uncultured Sphingopyxis sp.]|uniref:Uncharacterized protein n=1 Tax=uncultured Sphingopyxis sp. TaxID=310581 RepID=A0A1Y5PT49_9SPHN|nr:helix-turn-helix domain-containing protein [uncultured Sphingopyxis sp.]SBV31886.1 conserved protein of unknown function [uncultured Sphingopyxis sp.]
MLGSVAADMGVANDHRAAESSRNGVTDAPAKAEDREAAVTRRPVAEDRKQAARQILAAHEGLPTEPISVRVADAVKLTGIPRTTLYELMAAGCIETVKIGRSTFILYASLKRLFEKY